MKAKEKEIKKEKKKKGGTQRVINRWITRAISFMRVLKSLQFSFSIQKSDTHVEAKRMGKNDSYSLESRS